MGSKTNRMLALVALSALPGTLAAQEMPGDLASTDLDSLRTALESRYDAALAATGDDSVVSADDPRYLWASEAKVQCAIALGYLKSDTRDETSIGKCGYAFDRMSRRRMVAPRPVEPQVTVPQRPAVCDNRQAGLVFFDFDSDVPNSDAMQTVQFVTGNAETCGWRSFSIVGHTDRAGSDAYNRDLSMRRAEATARLMEGLGIARSRMTTSAEGESNPRVPTEDGVRNPQNRRVEISVSQ